MRVQQWRDSVFVTHPADERDTLEVYWDGRLMCRVIGDEVPADAVHLKSVPCVTRTEPVPPNRPWRRPQCEARVAEQAARYREHAGLDDRCSFRAHYDVNGQKLCHRHAAQVVIDALVEE